MYLCGYVYAVTHTSCEDSSLFTFTLKQLFCSFVLCSAGAVAVKQFAVRC